MCVFLQPEVLLANVLSKDEENCGVDKEYLVVYCEHIKKALAESPITSKEYIYFDVDNQSIKDAVYEYNNLFFEWGKRIYRNREINAKFFNSRYNNAIADVLDKVATKLTFEVCNK